MQPHVAMTNVLFSGPLRQIMTISILKFLEEVSSFTSPLCLTNYFLITTVEMDKAPTELHYRGDDHGTLAIVADG